MDAVTEPKDPNPRMARIAFLLMAHRDPAGLAAKARTLSAHGDRVVIHYDARSPRADWQRLKAELADTDGIAFARRVRCGWGEFSLVRATLNLIEESRRRFDGITHYVLLSGDCYPTKSRGFLDRYLDDDRDAIEVADFFGDWIRTGPREERLVYRHWFNERKHKQLFYASMDLQRRMGWARDVPDGLEMRIGSQWWALRAATVEKILGFIRERPDVVRFFRTTWIPDETFFQTLTAHLVPEAEISGQPPTHLRFSDYGMPVVFHEDHADYLRASSQPFARKISHHAAGLQDRLLATFESWDSDRPEGGASSNLYGYLAGRGRRGERYAPRFWERATDRRPGSQLLIVAAKLWHVGEAVQEQAARVAGVQGLGYLFDWDRDPDLRLGGLERGLAKRNRHRHALMNLIYDALKTDRLMLCCDTSRAEAIDEFVVSYGDVRILLVERPIPDRHVFDHARRAGLISDTSGAFEEREALTALTHEFAAEAEHLRRAYGDRLFVNDLSRGHDENVVAIGHFLRTTRQGAEAVARLAATIDG